MSDKIIFNIDDEVKVNEKYLEEFNIDKNVVVKRDSGIIKKIIRTGEHGLISVKWSHGGQETISCYWLEKVITTDLFPTKPQPQFGDYDLPDLERK